MPRTKCTFIQPHCGSHYCDGAKLVEWVANHNSNEHQISRLATKVNQNCERR